MGLIRQIGLIGKRGVALPIILLIALSVPSFWRMLKPGIFSMHDFHVFRLFEFHKCVLDLQIPCRWTPDASFGWGQPLFNFYNQLVYVFGEPFLLLGFQVIDTIKILFILSLVLSAVSMFFLARQMWGSALAGFLSALLYVYAPYRAVDVWVRGALPEAFAFVFYPLIILFFNRFILTEKAVYLFWFTVFLSCLLLVHNLSFLMFSVLFVFWAGFYLTVKQGWHLWKYFLPSGFLVLGISSFYLLPVVFESKLVSLGDITGGYYNFQIHFVSLKQLFWDRTWGYAASQWLHDEELSLSAGHVQWVLSIVIFAFALRRKQLEVLVLFVLGWFFLFLTHGKSLFIWETFPFLSFVQFPWRFLSLAVFSFALLGGSLVLFLTKEFLKKGVVIFLGLLTILVNFSFFREDIWYSISDHDEFSGERWDWHRSSAVSDFWPKYADKLPQKPAPPFPVFLEGEGEIVSYTENSRNIFTEVIVESERAKVEFPSVYFDGWRGFVDGNETKVDWTERYGQMAVGVVRGKHKVEFRFLDTPARRAGNLVSLLSLVFVLMFFFRKVKSINWTAKKVLFVIIILAVLVRVAGFGKVSPSLNWDEVSHGYNAYSILQTGKDEWGEKFPLIFRAYGDYKLPVYIYATALSEQVFGLSTLAVRFPSLLAGLATVFFTFLLAKKLFDTRIGLLVALLVAVEPWTFFLSRTAVEANLALALIVAGVYFFLRGIENPRWLSVSAILLGLSVWTYNSARIFVPLFIILLVWLYRNEFINLWSMRKKLVTCYLSLVTLFFLPMFWQLVQLEGQARYGRVAIIDEGAVAEINQARGDSEFNPVMARLIHNKVTYFVPRFAGNYFSHFSPKFLFLEGGSQYIYSMPGHGLAYIINSVFLFIGVLWLVKKRTRASWILLGWLLLSPIPSSLTREAPHALRSITMLPVPMILSALGLVEFYKSVKRLNIPSIAYKLLPFVYLVFLAVFVEKYLFFYFTQYRTDYSWSWQYGYEHAVKFVKSRYEDYDKVIVTKKYGEPHEFFLFYWPWDPAKYVTDPNLIRFYQDNWYWVDRFDKFYFVNDWDVPKDGTAGWRMESGREIPIDGPTLLITSPGNYPDGWNMLKRIYFLNGEIAFEILTNSGLSNSEL